MYAASAEARSAHPLPLTLEDLLRSVEGHCAGQRIIQFHASQLPPDHKKIKLAIDVLRASIVKQGLGDIVIVPNRDIVAWVRGMKLASIISLCRSIEDCFCEHATFSGENFYGEESFYTIIDASIDIGKFRSYVMSMAEYYSNGNNSGLICKQKQTITLENFADIVDIVRKSDITSYIFNQPIYDIADDNISIEFIEFYTSINTFEAAFCPSFSISGDPWLFNRLTEELDKAVLRHMGREVQSYRHKAFSLNLNLRSVLSKEFSVFAESLCANFASRIIIEINKLSMFSNWHLFEEICALARAHTFKICIDGMEIRDLANVRLDHLDFDFIKLRWSPAAMAEHQHVARAVQALSKVDRSKIVLSMCDSVGAFSFAQSMGIHFVQGRLADKYAHYKMTV